MDDVRIHRADCNGFDERVKCVGCLKAEKQEVISNMAAALKAAHDHMLMDPRNKGQGSRAFRMVTAILEKYEEVTNG
jgi:hypothetical protein